MKIGEENGGKVLVADMPDWHEYSEIIHKSEEAGKYISTDYKKFNELRRQITFEMEHLLANCIARGIRLAKEGKY